MSELENLIAQEQACAEMHAKRCAELIPINGLAAALEYCQQQGIEPPQCSLAADSNNARMLREKAARMLCETRWWERRLSAKAGRNFENRQIQNGKVTNIISDETMEYYLNKKNR